MTVDVIAPVIVAVHVNVNPAVNVIVTLDESRSEQVHQPCDDLLASFPSTVPITPTWPFPFTCTATITDGITSTSTITSTISDRHARTATTELRSPA